MLAARLSLEEERARGSLDGKSMYGFLSNCSYLPKRSILGNGQTTIGGGGFYVGHYNMVTLKLPPPHLYHFYLYTHGYYF